MNIEERKTRAPWDRIGLLNDGLKEKKKFKAQPPFLSLYKIVPSQGEVERYMRMSKTVGFPAMNRAKVHEGKAIETESLDAAKKNPGTLTKLSDITKKPGDSFSEGSDSDESGLHNGSKRATKLNENKGSEPGT